MKRVLLACVLIGCQRTETTTRTVNLHTSDMPGDGGSSCILPSGSFGQYIATGDYSPAGLSSLLATDNAGVPIDGVPSNVQSLALHVESLSPDWWGVTPVSPAASLDMLLLPSNRSCALATNVGFTQGMVFGAVSSRTLIAAGITTMGGSNASFRVDLTTGQVDRMSVGLKRPRTRAGFAQLGTSGGQAIVTGGTSLNVLVGPQFGGEIFDESTGDFEPGYVFLTTSRVDHAAVTLASGDVVLVGGTDATGNVLGAPASMGSSTERISFSQGQWIAAASTPPLATPRTQPFAARLANGAVVVAGGFDGSGNPVDLVEVFDAGFSTEAGSFNVKMGTIQGLTALDGGGALLVSNNPDPLQRAWFIPPGATEAVKVTPDAPALTDVKLVAASGGRAFLWTGSSWLVFDPWTGFAPTSVTTSTPATPLASPDPGMRAWIASDGTVHLWRDDARNGFSTEGPYLTTDASNTTPDHFADPTFQPGVGLALASTHTVYVADARYLDVGIDVHAPPGATVPYVVLRTGTGNDFEVGGATCALSLAGLSSLHVERRGDAVSYAFGGALQPCASIAPDARVAVGVRGGNAGSSVLGLTITRLGTPQP